MGNSIDVRLLKRLDVITNSLERKFTSSIHGLCGKRSESEAFYRFLKNKSITEPFLIGELGRKAGLNCFDKEVLALCDTSEFNFKKQSKRIKNRRGLGATSNNDSLGFFLHGILAIDAANKNPMGWAYTHIFNRSINNKAFTIANSSRPLKKKESDKWLTPSKKAKKNLKDSKHITFVMDREGDIFEVAQELTSNTSDVVIRSRHNRKGINDEGKVVKIYDDIKTRKPAFSIEINLTDRKTQRHRKIHKITCDVVYQKYEIYPPKHQGSKSRLPIYLVSVKERNPPKNVSPINWMLLSTKEVTTGSQALQIIDIYKTRWQIEEMFRLLKTEGFNLVKSELQTGRSIRKLLLLGMEVAIKIQQLKGARDGDDSIKITAVFEQEEFEFIRTLIKKYEGKTEAQKNPYPEETLPWASWLIARIGGWKGYRSQRPPGTITFKRGYDRYQDLLFGFLLRN